ncbi:hypothetical protein METSCH_A04810 [Metschnikowia aff. pulcherrima]|uniref:Uncharacterized protein n=1 Tax=Metschnikowia aff. pulcherrima TaxID=2163413 RepID=A0A4P6XEF8_9ASCO|nr:hypothetical protein METSCH_A04810 [Metschnikowia aff. pulcherrima]
MRHGHTVSGAQTLEPVPLHDTGKTFTLGRALDVNKLAHSEIVCPELGARQYKSVVGPDTKFGDFRLRRDACGLARTQHATVDVLEFVHVPDFYRRVAVFGRGNRINDLTRIDLDDCGCILLATGREPRDHFSLDA